MQTTQTKENNNSSTLKLRDMNMVCFISLITNKVTTVDFNCHEFISLEALLLKLKTQGEILKTEKHIRSGFANFFMTNRYRQNIVSG